jgi:ribosomal protein S18 acetylase RimI-like enzyme
VTDADREWARALVAERWGSEIVVARGRVHHPHRLPGFTAVSGDERIGLVTHRLEDRAAEIVTLDSLRPDRGIGTALIEAVVRAAREAGAERLRVVTTNDNGSAQTFYEKRGFSRVAVRPGAVTKARELKSEIPLLGEDGVPITDELEYQRTLQSPKSMA